MARIFLCHASEDKAQVRDVYQRLRTIEVLEPWLDEENLLPGQDWAYEIPRALETSDFILIFFSSNSVAKRGYMQREMKLALDALQEMPTGTIFTIPVRLDECEIPEPFRRYHYANLFDPRGFDRLVTALNHGLEQRGEQVMDSLETPRTHPTPPAMPPAVETETPSPSPETQPANPQSHRQSLWRNPTVIAALIAAIAALIVATIPEIRTFITHQSKTERESASSQDEQSSVTPVSPKPEDSSDGSLGLESSAAGKDTTIVVQPPHKQPTPSPPMSPHQDPLYKVILQGEIFKACGYEDLVLMPSNVGRDTVATLSSKHGLLYNQLGEIVRYKAMKIDDPVRLSTDCSLSITESYIEAGYYNFKILYGGKSNQ